MNRGPDVPLPWTFSEEVRISPELDGVVRFADISSSDVAADGSDRIYVLDRSGGRVRVFGRSGREVGSVGGPGNGPGELSAPVALAVSTDGALAVYDSAAGGVRRWNTSGDRSLERLEAPFAGPRLALAPWGIVYPSLDREGPDGRVVRLAVGAETRTGFLTEVKQQTVPVSFPSCAVAGARMPPIFTPALRWSFGGDVVAAATEAVYRFLVFDRGVLARTITRTLPPVEASRELALQEVGEGIQLTAPVRCRVPPSEVVEARGFAAVVPTISDLAVAPDGSFWVRRTGIPGTEDPPIDILDTDGSYLGTLPPGSPFPVAFAGRGSDYRVVALVTPSPGSTEVLVSRIDRND